jgi:hypothetical protein
MRLLDQVSQGVDPLIVALPDGALVELPSPMQLGPMLRATQVRYVLDGSVTEFAASFAFRETDRLLACMDLVRLPAQRLWVEWEDSERALVLRQAGFTRASMEARRVGVLIEGEPGGRRGAMQIVWSTAEGGPELSPIVLDFDLDDPTLWRQPAAGGARAYGAAFEHGGELFGRGGLETLFRHMRFRMRPGWSEYYHRQRLTTTKESACVQANCECVAAEFPFVMGFLLALGARNAVELSTTELDRLNRARARRGKPELLDYTEVSAQLGGNRHAAGGAGRFARAEVRQHFVAGHLVRRADHIFWRRSHLRGNPARGSILGRNIKLSMAPGLEPVVVAKRA